jgi:hypothetical protein
MEKVGEKIENVGKYAWPSFRLNRQGTAKLANNFKYFLNNCN